MQHKQYITDARGKYPDWESMSETDQQEILTDMYARHKQHDPLAAERLRKRQYQISKREKRDDVHAQTGEMKYEIKRLALAVQELQNEIERLTGLTEHQRNEIYALNQFKANWLPDVL